ncbi:hypothetical protein EXIGLDRAFT_664199 [Exidia glandulosa HHB12029]|uniref:MYND-type domain-containing protein n=1 Tax=Exidia glandulosa HHB12029 TaxID=1314781 RepID=A0A166BSA0_EXIGL|nr:hypothetical protein EXIGLDRAFT_664199 [Exidia glandulosa HHB12029]
MLTPEAYFGQLYKGARELKAAEKRGVVPDSIDFSVQEVCAACKNNITPPTKPKRCAACKSVLYCSLDCAKRDWATPPAAGAKPHRDLCADNKRHMQRLDDTVAIAKQFPWGRLEKDGSLNLDIARARFDVLGSDGYGFWSHRGGPVPHAQAGDLGKMFAANTPYAKAMAALIAAFDHLDGKDLLQSTHLTDAQGWKLPPTLIPYREFASPSKRPALITEFDGGVVDWDSWYRWRKLPKESPAALLMDFPMSVHEILVRCLQVTNRKAGSASKRVSLTVHYLGAEVELNFIPLFSELALLLPYHDIKLVMFGENVRKLGEEAKKKPSSLVAKSSPSTPVFTYKAPDECGSGAISVFLCTSKALWEPNMSDFPTPDALVACNAGLGSYREWIPVVQAAHRLEIPFGVTEYAEQSAEHQVANFPLMLSYGGIRPKSRDEYEIGLNPFQKPGQRAIPQYRLPNVSNGFTIVVVKRTAVAAAAPKSVDDVASRVAALDLDLD